MMICNRCGHDMDLYAPIYNGQGQRMCGFCQAPLVVLDPGQTNADPFLAQQDEVAATLDRWPKSKQLAAYRYLYAQGIRISNISYEERKAWKGEHQ